MNANLLRLMMAGTTEAAENNTGEGWDLTTFLTQAGNQLQSWGELIIIIIGVVLIIFSVFQIARKFVSPQSAPGGWAGPIIELILGGALLAGKWEFVSKIAKGGKKTIEDLGTTIIPMIEDFGMDAIEVVEDVGMTILPMLEDVAMAILPML